MLGTGRILGRRSAGQLRNKRKKRDLKKKAFSHFPSVMMHPDKKKDPYALPKNEDADKNKVVLSKDPMVRIMIEDNSDANYQELKSSDSYRRPLSQYQHHPRYRRRPKHKGLISTTFWNTRNWITKSLFSKRRNKQQGGSKKLSSYRRGRSSGGSFLSNSYAANESRDNLSCTPFRSKGGRLNSTCLWHAFRAISVGILFICLGITFSIFGFLNDQREIENKLKVLNQTQEQLMYAPGIIREDRFRLNNLSFAGPVVMGLGGFIIVASCVMTFESRDNAAKVGPSALSSQPSCEEKKRYKGITFRASSSQTTFLDRNIVQTLNPPYLSQLGLSNQTLSLKHSNGGGNVSKGECKKSSLAPPSFQSGSSHGTTKRASFDARYPQDANLEPGLALMDEIGRRALTNAFINFTRNTGNPKAYRDSLIYDGCCVSKVDNEIIESAAAIKERHQLSLPLAQTIPKCPSAPNIAHHKLDPNILEIRPEIVIDIDTSRQLTKDGLPKPINTNHLNEKREETSMVCGQYKVLTPTMYRSRMAATRQAQSMDYEGCNAARFSREGPALRIHSPFQRPLKPLTQGSLDLELGASATGVHNLSQIQRKQVNHHKEESEHSDCSMVLDLHVEGSAPVTLLVRDESRSTRSTSGNRETTSTTRSHSRSPIPPSPILSLGKQMSKECPDEDEILIADEQKTENSSRRSIKRMRRHSEPDSSESLTSEHSSCKFNQRNSIRRKSCDLEQGEIFSNREDTPSEDNLVKKRILSQSCEDTCSSPQPTSPGQLQQRWSRSLTTDLASFCYIDMDEDEIDDEIKETNTESSDGGPNTILDEEAELFMEFEDDIPDITEVFPVVFSIPKLDESLGGSSCSSSSNGRRHFLVRQAKVDSEARREDESEQLNKEDPLQTNDGQDKSDRTITF